MGGVKRSYRSAAHEDWIWQPTAGAIAASAIGSSGRNEVLARRSKGRHLNRNRVRRQNETLPRPLWESRDGVTQSGRADNVADETGDQVSPSDHQREDHLRRHGRLLCLGRRGFDEYGDVVDAWDYMPEEDRCPFEPKASD